MHETGIALACGTADLARACCGAVDQAAEFGLARNVRRRQAAAALQPLAQRGAGLDDIAGICLARREPYRGVAQLVHDR